MKYQVVSNMARDAQVFDSPEAMEAAGFKRNGRVGGQHLLPSLRGQPCFDGLCGPMHGSVDGKDAVRYEDAGSNDLLSR